MNQTVKGLGLVGEIINHATLNYIGNLAKRPHEGTQRMRQLIGDDDYCEVKIRLNDGRTITQYGNYVLYQMFRGTGQATPYLLQSVLMALEKYLLELASSDNEKDHKFLKLYFDHLFETSESIATTAVLVSIAMAYPDAVGCERICTLMSIKEIYNWDISRMASERDFLFISSETSVYSKYYQEERVASNQLPHRKRMFESFITELAFTKPEYKSQIFSVIDGFYAKNDKNDTNWKLKLNKMDIRKWQITDTVVSENQIGYVVEAVIDEDIKKEFEMFNQEQAKVADVNRYSNWAFFDIYQGTNLENNIYEEWVKAFKASVKAFDYGFPSPQHIPTAIAHIGLKYHLANLRVEEKEWCLGIIIKFSEIFIQKAKDVYDVSFLYDKTNTPNPFDEEPSLTILPFLLKEDFDKETHFKVVELIFEGLISWHFTDNLKRRYFDLYREHLWQVAPSVAMACWTGIIQLAKITKMRNKTLKMPKEYYGEKEYKLDEAFERQIIELKNNVLEGNIKPDFSDLSFDNYDSFLLVNTLLIIPYDTESVVLQDFIKHYGAILFETTFEKEDRFSYRSIDKMQDRLIFNEFMSFYLLNQPIKRSISVFDNLLSLIDKATPKRYGSDSFDFIDKTLLFMISQTDGNDKYINGFNTLWDYFESTEKTHFFDRLFLKLMWKQDADNWNPLKGRKEFYYNAIGKYGHYQIDAVLELLSGIGTTVLLPDCTIPFAEAIRQKEKANGENTHFRFYYAEKLIERMFCRHWAAIRGNRKILESFVYFLDKMVLQGSSLAFYVRENLIALS